MKKTIIALMALSSITMAADVTAHGITFTTTDLSAGIQKWTNRAENNYYITGGVSWGNGSGGYDFGGLYVDDQGGMKFNAANHDFNVKYLYLTSGVQIGASTGDIKGQINWSTNDGANFVMIDGGWVDINANYGSKIDASGMTTGSIYLNTAGALTLGSALSNNVTVYATVTDTVNIRDLLTGVDLTGWTGDVVLQNSDGTAYTAGEYIFETSTNGLSIVAVTVPEPATATLSLLALAGLAARRRRK